MTRFIAVDPAIPWAETGTAETNLIDRPGWRTGSIPKNWLSDGSAFDAMLFGPFGVHRMAEPDEGFTISLLSGCRISYGGLVFRTCESAMIVAEQLAPIGYWENVDLNGYERKQLQELIRLVRFAAIEGNIMGNRVFSR